MAWIQRKSLDKKTHLFGQLEIGNNEQEEGWSGY
jgi:hypothetical protein